MHAIPSIVKPDLYGADKAHEEVFSSLSKSYRLFSVSLNNILTLIEETGTTLKTAGSSG